MVVGAKAIKGLIFVVVHRHLNKEVVDSGRIDLPAPAMVTRAILDQVDVRRGGTPVGQQTVRGVPRHSKVGLSTQGH